jgi:outer membrane protein OmpA-like peptidoglycan-associated protein
LPLTAFRAAARVTVAISALALGACATGPTGSPSGGPVEPPAVSPFGALRPAPGGPGAAPQVAPIVTEQRWLEDWFRGTPVVIAAEGVSTLQVEVPLANSFDTGKADIKPALSAVLERVVEIMRRQAGARLTVSAPNDPGGAATLAQTRARRVREHIVARRIAAPHISIAEGTRSGGPIQLRLTIPAGPIARLDDSTLPVIVKPVATSRTANAVNAR